MDHNHLGMTDWKPLDADDYRFDAEGWMDAHVFYPVMMKLGEERLARMGRFGWTLIYGFALVVGGTGGFIDNVYYGTRERWRRLRRK